MRNLTGRQRARNTRSAIFSSHQRELRSTSHPVRLLIAKFGFSPAKAELIAQFAGLGGAR
jgi:hypothetical protein